MAFVRGAVWGLVVGGLGAAGASLVAPQPAGSAPPAPPLVAGPVSEPMPAPPAAEQPDVAVAVVAEPAAPAPAAEPVMTAPQDSTTRPAADTVPAAAPTAEIVAETLTPPQSATAPALTATADTPVLPNPQSLAPQIPETEQDVVVGTAPAAPPVEDRPEAALDSVAAVIVLPDADAPPVAAAPEAPVVAVPLAEETPGAAPSDAVAAIDMPTMDVATALPKIAPPPVTVEVETAVEAQPKTVLPQADSAEHAAPVVVSIINAAPRGLPGAGRSEIVKRSPATAPETGPETVTEDPVEVADDSAPALIRYAAFFDNPEAKPLMSVLLIDDGRLASGQAAVSEIPFPVTILLDPAQPDAAARMVQWRDAGFEVASLAALPEGATPSDVAVALEATFDTLPDSIAFVNVGSGSVLETPEDVAQVVENLAQSGRGLVTPEGGLNTALRSATAKGVPAATIYRDLDSSGQDARVIRRFVDQAAFRARQAPGVVLLGRVRPETISALVLWGTANLAGQVALAPLSATLLGK